MDCTDVILNSKTIKRKMEEKINIRNQKYTCTLSCVIIIQQVTYEVKFRLGFGQRLFHFMYMKIQVPSMRIETINKQTKK